MFLDFHKMNNTVVGVSSVVASDRESLELFRKSIHRIVIMDNVTKLSLFEKVFSWKGTNSTDGVDALIKLINAKIVFKEYVLKFRRRQWICLF